MLPLKLLALCSFIASGFQSINGQQFANAPQRTTSRPSSPTSTKGLREEEVERQILDQILRGKYDTNIRPSGIDAVNSETKVRVNLMLNSVSKIDDFNMEYRVQLTLRMEWNDSRLSYYNLNRTQNMKYLTIQDMKRVWIPDIYFINEKEAHFHSIIKPNFFIRIHPKGEVQFSCRLSLTLSCPMKLQLFPMDTQQCSILMSSYAWTIEDLDFNWRENDPVQLPDLSLPRFSLRETKTSVCDSVTVTGVYSCIKVDFTLDRNFSFYLTQMYIPCVMLVIVSWVSFWLDENAVPARTALGITT